MIIIFDLDYTLLNTKKFGKALAGVLGISPGRFENDYIQYFKKLKLNYNFKDHLSILKRAGKIKSTKAVQNNFKALFDNLDEFLFPSVKKILKELKKNNHRLILLTYGDREWQKKKVKHLSIKKYFDKIIVTNQDKNLNLDFLKDVSEKIIIVNDKAKEAFAIKKFLKRAKVILIKSKHSIEFEDREKLINIKDLFKYI